VTGPAATDDGLRADALAVMGGWVAPDEAQEVLRRRYVAHLAARPDGLRRACRPDHVTASTLVLSADHAHVLLTLHAKAQRWFQVGGHCEAADLTLAGAARREALEETGLDADALRLDPVPVQLSEHAVPFCRPEGEAGPTRSTGPGRSGRAGTTHHLDVRFVAVAAPGAGVAVSEESLDLRWWPVDALPVTPADPQPDLVDLVVRSLARVGDPVEVDRDVAAGPA